MDTIKLKNPIKVNGKEWNELPYDFDAITVEGFMRAESEAAKTRQGQAGTVSLVETDYAFQLYLAFEAIVATAPDIDINDLKRLTGADVMAVMRAGRFFILQSAVDEGSTSETSEPQSDGTRESSTPARTK